MSFGRGRFLLPLVLVLSVALCVALHLLVQPPVWRDEMPGGSYQSGGIFNPRPTEYGLLEPATAEDGTTYRVITDHATITFPYMAYMGRYADITIKMGSLGDLGGPGAIWNVSMNGRQYARVEAGAQFSDFNFTLDTRETPNPYLDPAHIQVDIESGLIVHDAPVFLAVDSVELRPRRDLRDVVMVAGAWALGMLAVGVVSLRRFARRWAAIYMGAALVTLAVTTFTYVVRPFPPAYEAGLVGLAWLVAVAVAPRERPGWGLALGALAVWVALGGRLLNDWQMDDAYISYRYGWNLAHGQGLVYNVGEVPVEGYTNFLWTVIAAAVIGLGFAPGGVMLALIVACSIVVLGVTYVLALRVLGGSRGDAEWWAFVCVLLLVVDAIFVTYGVKGSGIEAVPFALLVLVPIVVLWPRDGVAIGTIRLIAGGFTLGVAALMRPEGVGIALILVAVKAWQARGSAPGVWKTVGMIGVPFLVVVVPYQIWRVLFYGYLFPNTFYAKTGTSAAILERGWMYVWAFAGDHWLVVGLVLLGGAMLATRRTGAADVVWALYGVVSAYVLYIVAIGGDHYPAGRFFVPLVAPMVVMAVGGACGVITNLGRTERVHVALAGVVLVGVLGYVVTALQLEDGNGALARRTNRDTNFVNIWGSMGLWLRDNTAPDTLAASPVAGAIAYYGQRNVVDMLGITDAHIGHKEMPDMGSGLAGHEKQDPEYVLGREPGYILPYPNYFDALSERFASEYVTSTVQGPLNWPMQWWERR